MKRAVVSVIAMFLVACGSSGADRIAADNSVSPGESTSVPGPQAFTTQPMDESLPEFVPNEYFTTGPFEHSCGTYSLVQEFRSLSMRRLGEGGTGGEFVPGVSIEFSNPVAIAGNWLTDVTGDGDLDIVMSWYTFASNHTSGTVFVATQPDCQWKQATIIGGCYTDTFAIDLFIPEDGVLTNFNFGGCGAFSDSRLEWNDEYGVFLYEPMEGSELCEEFIDWDSLPIPTCREGWVVDMLQAAMRAEGIAVDDSGRFERSTRVAVLEYQRHKGLDLTGEVDRATWAVMYPVGGPDGDDPTGYPDFDGDGISSPIEIRHAADFD